MRFAAVGLVVSAFAAAVVLYVRALQRSPVTRLEYRERRAWLRGERP